MHARAIAHIYAHTCMAANFAVRNERDHCRRIDNYIRADPQPEKKQHGDRWPAARRHGVSVSHSFTCLGIKSERGLLSNAGPLRLIFFFNFKMHLLFFILSISVCHVCFWCWWRPGENIRSPGTVVNCRAGAGIEPCSSGGVARVFNHHCSHP